MADRDGDGSGRAAKRPKIFIDICSKPRGEAVCPPHGCILRGMCTRCRQQVEDLTSCTRFDFIDKGLWIADWKADMMRKSNTAKLLQQKRLILILDLDHTLLHSRKFEKVAEKEAHLISMANRSTSQNEGDLFRVESLGMITKLRPFVRTFLREAGTMFDLYVYTMGTRVYAIEMAKILDPEGDIFYGSSRVIAREDCSTEGRKGLDVVLGEERVVVILDDTKEVWERHPENLIQMERYNFFGSQYRHNVLGESSSEFMKIDDESEEYGALATTLGVLKQLHSMFFEPNPVSELSSRDTREVLKKIRGGSENRKTNSSVKVRLRLAPATKPNKSLKFRIKVPPAMKQFFACQPCINPMAQEGNMLQLQAT